MTKSELQSLVNNGPVWAQVENFLAQQSEEIRVECMAQTKTVQDKLDAAMALYEKAKSALQSGDIDTLKAIHTEVEKPAIQREIESLDVQITELQQRQKDLVDKLPNS